MSFHKIIGVNYRYLKSKWWKMTIWFMKNMRWLLRVLHQKRGGLSIVASCSSPKQLSSSMLFRLANIIFLIPPFQDVNMILLFLAKIYSSDHHARMSVDMISSLIFINRKSIVTQQYVRFFAMLY